MTDELKPCPFCGGVAYLVDNTEKMMCADHAYAWAGCVACSIEGPEKYTVADAIAAWNTRADSKPGNDPLLQVLRREADTDDRDWEYDDEECSNCGGEGFVYGCSWDWQCDTWDGDSCLCTRPCDWCHPPKPNPELQKVLGDALAAKKQCEQCHGTGVLCLQDCGAHGLTQPCPGCVGTGQP